MCKLSKFSILWSTLKLAEFFKTKRQLGSIWQLEPSTMIII